MIPRSFLPAYHSDRLELHRPRRRDHPVLLPSPHRAAIRLSPMVQIDLGWIDEHHRLGGRLRERRGSEREPLRRRRRRRGPVGSSTSMHSRGSSSPLARSSTFVYRDRPSTPEGAWRMAFMISSSSPLTISDWIVSSSCGAPPQRRPTSRSTRATAPPCARVPGISRSVPCPPDSRPTRPSLHEREIPVNRPGRGAVAGSACSMGLWWRASLLRVSGVFPGAGEP
jgi:hypothetical protein